MAQQRDKPVGFKTVQLLKDKILGIGSYGKVCKAKCDDLLCAAKLIHETLFDPTAQQLIAPQREHRLPMRRFEQECEFLSTIRHPNIVQYLGVCRDPDTGLPALLMELMDDSLTHFLESSPQPIPYHIQVNICHDITLALSFLHSNGIVHRDLSSNNVLLEIGNMRAKVTDFGMARLGNQNPQATPPTFTKCPGTDVYMPPEAVQEDPVYTEKIDCFSFGVIVVQTITQQFPEPSNRKKKVQWPVSLPGFPSDALAEVPIPETERRQNHIDKIEPNHPLLQVALDCLNDRDIERPSAQQLREQVSALKERPQYNESVTVVEIKRAAEQGRSDDAERELRSLRQQHKQKIKGLQQIMQLQINRSDRVLKEKDEALAAEQQRLRELEKEKIQVMDEIVLLETQLREKDATIEDGQQQLKQLQTEKSQAVEDKGRLERQLEQANQQLEESKRMNAQFQRQVAELLEQLPDMTSKSEEPNKTRSGIKLTWKKGEKARCIMRYKSCCGAAMDGSALYVRALHLMYRYSVSTSSWSKLPSSPTDGCPSVIVNNLLTLVGGKIKTSTYLQDDVTNQLFSLTGEGSGRRWTEKFPPMPTKRWGSTALVTGTALIVVGGLTDKHSELKTVEVMSTTTQQWSIAADLPHPLAYGRAVLCGNRVYILGRSLSPMYTCSVNVFVQHPSLLASLKNIFIGGWKEVAAPPVKWTAGVSIRGRLLAIGGNNSQTDQPTSAIHMYNPATDSWTVISHMETRRYDCIAAVLPNNQLMVVGGCTDEQDHTRDKTIDSVELATVN
jgi:serine/threonine protein kinase